MATAKKKYNFKGLDEIFGESVKDVIDVIETNKEVANEIKSYVLVDDLKPNPYQPRKIFEPEEIEELAQSIERHGIIQPVIITKNNEIVAGERRVRAAKSIGLKEVPVVILELSNQQMEEFAIIENIQRVDLTDIEEAIAYKQLSVSLKLKQEQIASRVGKSRSHVANIMRLLNLPQKIQDAMLEKKVTMGQAKPLLSILNDTKLLNEIFEKILKEDLTAREVEALIKNGGNTPEQKEKKQKDTSTIYTENRLMRRLGTKVTIENQKLTIKYLDNNDLNRILEILGLLDED
ncbi:chromosome partitioning protein ParB [Spiroplasma helicoides]|uniref:Chromosome partitioning protein ParB n=1 Tax=Spiroplasma helicoides TaxID=216938 RepID=A0A1B3SMB4_9MOLU|nr:ParB/RepB/Spo0J family partition protein [Spiroplasma helicoides]AOG61071.1 chromosome partitioning protein ParB [Spiroplasma helicoides]